MIRERNRLGANISIFADIHVKHAVSISSKNFGLAIEEMKKVEALGIKPICQLSVQSILGLAYHRIGKYDLAVKHLEKFFALGGKSKVNAKFLSMAKAAQKNTN